MTATARKGLSLPLTFLGDGDYEAVIYSDNAHQSIDVTAKTVTNQDTLVYDMQAESGYVVQLTRKR